MYLGVQNACCEYIGVLRASPTDLFSSSISFIDDHLYYFYPLFLVHFNRFPILYSDRGPFIVSLKIENE
jgi:hypothetical protein